MKVKCGKCGKTHRSYKGTARCRFGLAYRGGEGAYATLHYNHIYHYGLLCTLHKTLKDAQEFARIAGTGEYGATLGHSAFNGIWEFTRRGQWVRASSWI